MCKYSKISEMMIHCQLYWDNMNKLIENIHNGKPSYDLIWCNEQQKEEVLSIIRGD